MMYPAELDAEAIFATLAEHKVEYVVIGGFAGVLHGSARATEGVDITPATTTGNLERLAEALKAMDAELLVPDGDTTVPWPWSADSLTNFTTVTTRTRHGDLDIAFRPDGPGGRDFDYDRLAQAALVITLNVDVPVASLEDVIASKRASDRPKDHEAIRTLQALLDRLRSLGM
jgi:hypothetical protein